MTRLLSLMPRIFSGIPALFSREEKNPTVKWDTITFQYPFKLEAYVTRPLDAMCK